MNKSLFTVALTLILSTPVLSQAQQQGPEKDLGDIVTFAGNYCPIGFAPTDGRLIKINDQTKDLFKLVGSSYGGDGKTTFALPKLTPMATVNGKSLTSCITTKGPFPTKES